MSRCARSCLSSTCAVGQQGSVPARVSGDGRSARGTHWSQVAYPDFHSEPCQGSTPCGSETCRDSEVTRVNAYVYPLQDDGGVSRSCFCSCAKCAGAEATAHFSLEISHHVLTLGGHGPRIEIQSCWRRCASSRRTRATASTVSGPLCAPRPAHLCFASYPGIGRGEPCFVRPGRRRSPVHGFGSRTVVGTGEVRRARRAGRGRLSGGKCVGVCCFEECW